MNEVAGAARAELVLGTAELGLGAFARKGFHPKFAAEMSMGIGDFDLYGEVALSRRGRNRIACGPRRTPSFPRRPPPPPGRRRMTFASARLAQVVNALYPVYRPSGYRAQSVVGLNYSQKYNDNDTFTVGAEYFFNPLGYSRA